MVRLSNCFVILSFFSLSLAIAAPQFDQGAEQRKSDCDNGCFYSSFPGGSCTNDPACMCNQKKYREAYFCCMAKKCDSDVMPESIERQHTECRARNLDFTFDAEKVCGINLDRTTTCHASSTPVTVTTSHTSRGPPTTSTTISTISEAETTTVSSSVERTSNTATESPTGGAAPMTNGAPQLDFGLSGFAVLFMIAGILL
ncbi:hypothetical protein FBEOM_6160 [Fusarium beomiforme]|uniref:CFEM domain-containing protein n=1 Tax=Fusarium beomiforme TaxID=44412 RepID=A0A9P5AJK5_9HYPO|nr:hypothetical protein FBEOM_6160 [Fusarium beomiforme]